MHRRPCSDCPPDRLGDIGTVLLAVDDRVSSAFRNVRLAVLAAPALAAAIARGCWRAYRDR